MPQWFKRLYFIASMRWHLVADGLWAGVNRLIRAGNHIAISLVVAFSCLWVAEERGWLKFKTKVFDFAFVPPPPAQPAPPRISVPMSVDSVSKVVTEPLPHPSQLLVIPEALPEPEPMPAPVVSLPPARETAVRRQLKRVGGFVKIESQAEGIHAKVDFRKDDVKNRAEPYDFRALDRPNPAPTVASAKPEPPAATVKLLSEPVRLSVAEVRAPAGPDILASRVPVRGGGALPLQVDAPTGRDEPAELRAAREAFLERQRREWRRDMGRRLGLGLGLSFALLIVGFFASGLYRGRKVIPAMDPDAPLSTKVDASQSRPYLP